MPKTATKKSPKGAVQHPSLPGEGLDFSQITPVARNGLGGLVREHFCHGRLNATVAWHGGIVTVSYLGKQHLGAGQLYNVGIESAWLKCFRACVGLGKKRYYLPLQNTKFYPFGMGGEGHVIGVDFKQELLLLPDALVQRFSVLKNPKKQPVFIEMFHQEKICRVGRDHRTWSDFKFEPKLNAMTATCLDTNPERNAGEDCLAQAGLPPVIDAPRATTYIGVGCSTKMKARTSMNGFKIYFTSEQIKGDDVSFFLVFADSKEKLAARLKELSKTVGKECDALVGGYEKRLQTRPKIDVGNPILNSAFGQYPEWVKSLTLPDRPGAVKASATGYFIWGWDGMTPMMPFPLANEAQSAADSFNFFQDTLNSAIGIPLAFTTDFGPKLKEPFPAQAQFIASLYHYVSLTGDLKLAKKVLPTCKFILDRCRKKIVKDSGLVDSNALWPDFPEAMGEDGNDISSLNNSLLYQGLRAIEYIAGAVGDEKLAADCRDWAKKLRVSFQTHLFDKEQGYFVTSCSSKNFALRKHYGCATVYWITPFARELVSHAPGRIASFMHKELRSAKCLLSLPQWDTAWMAEGNQLGSSYPTADYFYLNVHKLVAGDHAIKAWLGDVEWFWKYHTAPEAFTPEAENEDEFGPDNHGGKQCQAITCWYTNVYQSLAGMDFDHEGVTFTPWSDVPVNIRGLELRGKSVDIKVSGEGSHTASLKVDGRSMPAGSRKIPWSLLKKGSWIEFVRSKNPPKHPVIVRADGLRVSAIKTSPKKLIAQIDGDITGEVVVQASTNANVTVNGEPQKLTREASTGTIAIPFENTGPLMIEVSGA